MADLSQRLSEALDAVGARLKRSKKHLVFELPNGRNVVVAATPSDHRAHLNAIRDVRAAVGVEALPERRKASAEVREERRRRPGRNGDAPWKPAPAEMSPLAQALSASGLVEQQLRAEIAELSAGVTELTQAIDKQAATIRAKDAQIAALESLWVVRALRWLR